MTQLKQVHIVLWLLCTYTYSSAKSQERMQQNRIITYKTQPKQTHCPSQQHQSWQWWAPILPHQAQFQACHQQLIMPPRQPIPLLSAFCQYVKRNNLLSQELEKKETLSKLGINWMNPSPVLRRKHANWSAPFQRGNHNSAIWLVRVYETCWHVTEMANQSNVIVKFPFHQALVSLSLWINKFDWLSLFI